MHDTLPLLLLRSGLSKGETQSVCLFDPVLPVVTAAISNLPVHMQECLMRLPLHRGGPHSLASETAAADLQQHNGSDACRESQVVTCHPLTSTLLLHTPTGAREDINSVSFSHAAPQTGTICPACFPINQSPFPASSSV